MGFATAWKVFNEGLGLPAKIVGFVTALGVVAAWIPDIRDWIHTHPAHIETFLFVELFGIGAVALVLATKDIGRLNAAHVAVRVRDDRKRQIWERFHDGFSYIAAEMRPNGPSIRFMLPPLPDFDPAWIPVLTATCSMCKDHPSLCGGANPDGTDNGLHCHECQTVFSRQQPGVVEGDALRALQRTLKATS